MRRLVFTALLAAETLLSGSFVHAETPAEKAMAQQIGSRLKDSGELHNYRIGVKYSDGLAWLSGTVTSQQQREAAVRLTEQIPGVTRVVSKLEVPGQPGTAAATSPVQTSFNEAALIPTGKNPSGVVQALASAPPPNGSPQLPASPRMARKQQSMLGGNMPRPMAQMSGSQPMPLNGGQNISPASCSTCSPGGPGMAAGGGIMMGGGSGPMP